MKTAVYGKDGKEKGTTTLPESVFGLPWNADLVHQVVYAMRSNARTPVAHTKDRGDVSGGGKKPWRQKGTGRARHGSIRSPIWKGGGVTHGPSNEKNYSKNINKKMRAKALYTVLSEKLRNNEIIFVEDLGLKAPKTVDAKNIIASLGGIKEYSELATKKNNALFLAIPKQDEAVQKSFQNFGNIVVNEVRNLNPSNLLDYKYLVISHPKESINIIESRMKKEVKANKEDKKEAKTDKK